MAGWFYPPAPPQPAAVYAPPNAAASSNVPPNPVGSGSLLIRSIWPQESWSSQVLIGGGVGGLTAPVFVPPVAIAAANPTILASIMATWPPEQWSAQRAAQIASLFATAANPPIAYPSPPIAQPYLRLLWPQEYWYAQSESGIASGIAQTQQPPIYIPRPFARVMALLRSIWPTEDWGPQTTVRGAGWIPEQQPVAPLPMVIRHPEILLWTADTWAAQSGIRNASILAQVPSPQPYVNRWLSAALRSTWLPEDWPAQTFPDIASGQSLLVPPFPRSPSQLSISLWPVELWDAQPGTRDAAILASAAIVVLMPFVVGLPEAVAILELKSVFAATVIVRFVHSGAPVGIVVYQSIAAGTQVFSGEAVTLQVSIGPQIGPVPCPIVESILVSNIPVVLALAPSNVKVVH